jgi:eukaryotic-like serine/threonine-protein kinase
MVLAGKYVLERPAGFGGMAELWVATNRSTSAEVCVKLLARRADPKDPKSVEDVERFRREARAAANLRHRAIVHVFDFLELDANGQPTRGDPDAYAIVMELLSGRNLADHLDMLGPMRPEKAIDVFLEVLSAVAHAHSVGVIHRDLKPENVFLAVEPDEQVVPKVLDFGISKLQNTSSLTNDGIVVGTPAYMSPEQATGERDLGPRSDVFSAALLLVAMLRGESPFGNEKNFADTVDAIVRRKVPPIEGLSPAVQRALDRALSKDPKVRFADAADFADALRSAIGRPASMSLPTGTNPPLSARLTFDNVVFPGSTTPAPRVAPRQRVLYLIAGAAAVAALIVVGLFAAARERKPRIVELPPRPPALASSAQPLPSASSAALVDIVETDPNASVPVATRDPAPSPSKPPAPPGKPRPRGEAGARTHGEEPSTAREPGF